MRFVRVAKLSAENSLIAGGRTSSSDEKLLIVPATCPIAKKLND